MNYWMEWVCPIFRQTHMRCRHLEMHGQHSEHEGLLDGLEPQRSRRFVFFAVGYTTWLIDSQIVYLGNL